MLIVTKVKVLIMQSSLFHSVQYYIVLESKVQYFPLNYCGVRSMKLHNGNAQEKSQNCNSVQHKLTCLLPHTDINKILMNLIFE